MAHEIQPWTHMMAFDQTLMRALYFRDKSLAKESASSFPDTGNLVFFEDVPAPEARARLASVFELSEGQFLALFAYRTIGSRPIGREVERFRVQSGGLSIGFRDKGLLAPILSPEM